MTPAVHAPHERVAETIYTALRELHRDWAAKVGPARFTAFMGVLRELAEPDSLFSPQDDEG